MEDGFVEPGDDAEGVFDGAGKMGEHMGFEFADRDDDVGVACLVDDGEPFHHVSGRTGAFLIAGVVGEFDAEFFRDFFDAAFVVDPFEDPGRVDDPGAGTVCFPTA